MLDVKTNGGKHDDHDNFVIDLVELYVLRTWLSVY